MNGGARSRGCAAHHSHASAVWRAGSSGVASISLNLMVLRSLALCAVCALWGCSLEVGRAGASCKRSTQCESGLACVRGKCSKDLGPIADESTVPNLGTGMEGDAPAADGGGM
jgi:hypothetical protein